MERVRCISGPAVCLAGFLLVCGCAQQAQVQKKQQMVQAWEKSAVQAKLPVARDLLDRNQTHEAAKVLKECVQVDPEHPELLFLIARLHLAEGRNETARQYLLKSLDIDSRRDEAWFTLGILQQEYGHTDQALASTLRALELQPVKIDYILALAHLYTVAGQMDQARSLLEEKRKLLPYDFELIMASADLALRNGSPQEAIQLYKEAVLKQGNNPRLLEALGRCYIAGQQWRQAADVFEKLLTIQKDAQLQEHALYWAAFCSLQAGRFGSALSHYDRLSVLRREDPQVWLEMGQAALGAESADRARYCGEKALQLKPNWTDAEAVIGCALYMKKNYTGAVGVFQKVCRDPQWEAFGWWMAGRCYQQLGQNALARGAFEKASQLKPQSPMMQMFMGEAKQTGSGNSEKTL